MAVLLQQDCATTVRPFLSPPSPTLYLISVCRCRSQSKTIWCYLKIAFYQLGGLEQTYVRGLAVFFLKVKPMFSGLIKRKLNFVRPREFRIDFRVGETWSKRLMLSTPWRPQQAGAPQQNVQVKQCPVRGPPAVGAAGSMRGRPSTRPRKITTQAASGLRSVCRPGRRKEARVSPPASRNSRANALAA